MVERRRGNAVRHIEPLKLQAIRLRGYCTTPSFPRIERRARLHYNTICGQFILLQYDIIVNNICIIIVIPNWVN